MTHLFVIREPRYLSYLDEKNFFSWLGSIDDVAEVTGSAEGLRVKIVDSGLSRSGLSDLIALLARYSLDMRPLHDVVGDDDKAWFAEPNSFWNKMAFHD